MQPPRSDVLNRLGRTLARHRWKVVIAWIVAILVTAPFASTLSAHLDKGAAFIPGSESRHAQDLLEKRFANPFVNPIVVVVHSASHTVDEPGYRKAIADLATSLRGVATIEQVAAVTDAQTDTRLKSEDGHSTIVLVGPKKTTTPANEVVNQVRAAVKPHREAFQALDADFKVAITGAQPLAQDMVGRTSAESAKAEKLVLLPALFLLLLVFASPLAALLPVLLGVAASVLAWAAASGAARVLSLNAYVPTTISMLGLALGIDYCLLMVSRFREALRAGMDPGEAAAETVGTAGWTVLTSGVVVLISLSVMIPLGMIDAVSVGTGGALVVFMAIALSLTLLPALLVLLAPWLDWPKAITTPLLTSPWKSIWAKWGAMVTRHKWIALGASMALLLAMASPVFHYNIGLPDVRWYPQDVEAVNGSQMLANLGRQGLTFPIQVIVERKDHAPILQPDGVRKMLALSRQLHADDRVGTVLGPVDLREDLKPLHYAILYAKPDQAIAKYPQIGQLFLSTDRQMAYMQVLPSETTSLAKAKNLVRELRATSDDTFQVTVGGMVANNLDYENRLKAALPWVVGTVFAVTGLLLFVAFRSILVPLKAILLNVLAVSAAIGATVAVFQDGVAHDLVGMAGGMGALPLMVPLLVFCLTFGLSMDYELFMLTRVREERATAPDEATAITRGLLATGSVITAAALIMVLVFGAFVSADMIFVKLLGFGLGMAIALEATVIRTVLAPALLNIAGKWNWWPGERQGPSGG